MRPRLVLSLVVAILGAACQQADGPDATGRTPTGSKGTSGPTPTGTTGPGNGDDVGVDVELQQIATLEQPLALATRAGDESLYVAEKMGRVVAIRPDGGEPEVVLDLSNEVSTGANEQGLLGLVFSPRGDFLFVNFTDPLGDTRVVSFPVDDDGVDADGRREMLFVDQPFGNHNGGNLVFGPDGYLYIGLGDGGDRGDPFGNGQSLSTHLGKMLRIAPTPDGAEPYTVPNDNPFIGRDGALPEIWAYGLRNPWRYTFDRETGDLWIGDVGQQAWEEINVVTAGSGGGQNFGWNLFEGSHEYAGGSPDGVTFPVHEYPTGSGTCAVTGGYVYRGSEIPELVGVYVFGDFCRGRIEALVLEGDSASEPRDLGLEVRNLASFGEDADGELYVLSLDGPVFRLVPAAS